MDRKKLALVHIVKKELNLSDEAYREILRRVTGVSSAKELDEPKFKKLMTYFVRSRHYRVNADGLTVKQKLFLKYLGGRLGWDPGQLDGFLSKYYHKSHLDQLTRKEAMRAIESLKAIKERRERSDTRDIRS